MNNLPTTRKWKAAFEISILIFPTLFLHASSSSSNGYDEAYVRLNNTTLLLRTFLNEYCVSSSDTSLDYNRCNESLPNFYCSRTNADKPTCLQWCIGESETCSEVEECCGGEFDCIQQICRSANLRFDFVLVVKVALAALIVTTFAVFILCCKGFIGQRCANYSSSSVDDDDNASTNAERFTRVHGSPDYAFPSEKPPPYEECVQSGCSSWNSNQDPPPYSVAIHVNQLQSDSLPDAPARYFLAAGTEIAQLNLQSIKLQNIPVENVTEVIISSPVNNMDDFVYLSTETELSIDTQSDEKTSHEVLCENESEFKPSASTSPEVHESSLKSVYP